MRAKVTPFSSMVGQSVMLSDETGAVVAQLSISIPDPSRPYRETAEEIARIVELAINQPPSEEVKKLRVRLGDLMVADAKRMAAASLSSAPAQEDGSQDLGAHPRGSGQNTGNVGARDAVFRRLLTAAKLLYANSEGCAVNHYGDDFEIQGLPGWLSDCAADIKAASDFFDLRKSHVCEVCGGDCSAANPPPSYCPARDDGPSLSDSKAKLSDAGSEDRSDG